MNAGTVARYVILFATFLCVLEIGGFLVVYWKVIGPIRSELGDKVIAPPLFLTSLYQVLVGLLMVSVSVGIVYSLDRGTEPTPAVYAVAGITVAITVTVGRFYAHYAQRLKDFRAKETA